MEKQSLAFPTASLQTEACDVRSSPPDSRRPRLSESHMSFEGGEDGNPQAEIRVKHIIWYDRCYLSRSSCCMDKTVFH